MTWIRTISYQQSTGRLRELYDRIKGPGDVIDGRPRPHGFQQVGGPGGELVVVPGLAVDRHDAAISPVPHDAWGVDFIHCHQVQTS